MEPVKWPSSTAASSGAIILGSTCPAVTSVPQEIADRFQLDTSFYKKYVEACGGIPGTASINNVLVCACGIVREREGGGGAFP
jgi:hypothetical protein